jgi:hypothetical protein
MKRAAPEHRIQVALMDYLRLALRPELEVRAIPNGEKRHIRVASRLKAEGVRRGTPDIFVCLPQGRIGWLEMKAPKGVLSPEQKHFRDKVLALGHFWALARTVDQALEHLTEWDALRPAYRRAPAIFKTNHLETIQFKAAKEHQSGTQA